jgi:hypothetical protein
MVGCASFEVEVREQEKVGFVVKFKRAPSRGASTVGCGTETAGYPDIAGDAVRPRSIDDSDDHAINRNRRTEGAWPRF